MLDLVVRADSLYVSPVDEGLVIGPIQLSVGAGQVVAVMGPSGCGKSTLLATVAGLRRVVKGGLVVMGHVMSGRGSKEREGIRRENMGLLFQDAMLLPELTVEQNVALPLIFDGVRREQALSSARAGLARVGLAERASGRVDEISGGEAQRVALARALIRPQTKLLIADEPTASLDRRNADLAFAILKELCWGEGVAAIVATHDPLIAEQCDRTVDLSTIPTTT